MDERLWDYSILSQDGQIIHEGFDFESEDEAESAAMEYIDENGITDYVLDVSQPDA